MGKPLFKGRRTVFYPLCNQYIDLTTVHKAIKILTYMLQSNVNLNKKDSKEQTILHLALEDGFCEFVKLLILKYPVEYCSGRYYRKLDCDGNNELFKCVNHNCLNCLKHLLNKCKYNWKDVNKIGNNIFHQTAICNNYGNLFNKEETLSNFFRKFIIPSLFTLVNMIGTFFTSVLLMELTYHIKINKKIFNDLIATRKFDINSLTKNNESILNLSIKHSKKEDK